MFGMLTRLICGLWSSMKLTWYSAKLAVAELLKGQQ
jgi:hypothetical protein